MGTSYVLSLTILAVLVGVLLLKRYGSTSSNDGEQKLLKLPLIGDIHKSPIDQPLKNWNAWVKEHGAVALTKLFGIVPLIVVNTNEAATELLSRRSAWYSNRPYSTSMEMITGAERGKSRFTLMHDQDEHLILHHRVVSPSLGAIAAPKYQRVFELEAKKLLVDLLQLIKISPIVSSTDVYPLLERTQASNILALHYGIRIPDVSEPIYHAIIDVQKKVTHYAANPILPDIIPALRHLPGWISPWKAATDRLFNEQKDVYLRLLEMGDTNKGWNATKQARIVAAKYAHEPIPDVDLAFTLATSIQGGMETSPRALVWLFVAAIVAEKDFMSRAHDILDKVVGRDRLPTYADRSKLTYIDAIVSELMRWRPISPGSIPRRADKEDEYNGVKIAKGVTILINAWSIGRDPDAFSPDHGDLEDFIPERWLQGHNLNEDVLQQGQLRPSLPLPVFGQGRRMCMGKKVALDGSFMQIAALLWAFDIEKVEGEDVNAMDMRVVGFMTETAPFRFRLKPRGAWVGEVVEREYGETDKDVGNLLEMVDEINA